MTELLTTAQMRAIEMAAIESGEVTGLELMERAGQGVLDAIFDEWPEMAERGASPSCSPEYLENNDSNFRAIVVCGPGNNGGDGFVVARLLKHRGWMVEVFLYGDAEKLPPDARTNYERWCEVGEVFAYIDEGENVFCLDPKTYRENTIVLDALFGTGLTRPVEQVSAFGRITQISEWKLNKEQRSGEHPAPRVVSVDIASGICADSGTRLQGCASWSGGVGISADLTVAFHAKKLGHVLAVGPNYCGKVVVADIGLDPHSKTTCKALADLHGLEYPGAIFGQVVAREAVSDALTVRVLDKHGEHKFTHGHALILSGGSGKTGAARLAARGALRIGAGVVTLGVPSDAWQEVACQITALMMVRVGDASALDAILGDRRLNALCVGPGFGFGEEQVQMVRAVLASKRACVFDADALTLIAQNPSLFDLLHDRCVLTPHGGEFARLFPDIAARFSKVPAYSKVDVTREAAARAGCTVLFKGPDSVIADENGVCVVNCARYARSAPWLATAGSGDVLAGFITGLLARGVSPQKAAAAGAWLHVESACAFGPGLIAEDLPEVLPKVLCQLVAINKN